MKLKRTLTLLLALCMLASAFAVFASADSAMLGDVNGNGKIDAQDYMMVKRNVLGTFVIEESVLEAADVNGNGKIDAQDYMMIKRHVLGTYTIEQKPTDTPDDPDKLVIGDDPAYGNVTADKSYERTELYNSSYPDEDNKSLTNGIAAAADAKYGNEAYTAFNMNSSDYKAKGYAHVTVDLGGNHLLDTFKAYVGSSAQGAGIKAPAVIWAYISPDGASWFNAGALSFEDSDTDKGITASLSLDSALSARYVQFRFLGTSNWIFVSEVEAYGIASDTVTSYPIKKQLSFLFVGNSATYYFNVPLKLKLLAESAGVSIDVEVCCFGSAYLSYFADPSKEHGIALRKQLAEKQFDYVVLQDNSGADYEDSKPAIDIIKPLIDANGAQMLLYKRYSSNTDPAQRLDSAYRHEVNYTKLAETYGVEKVAPGADAFLICTEKYPEINLYYTDNSHHGEVTGAYLIACTMAVEFLGIDLSDATYKDTLDTETANKLKECAKLACEVGYDYPQDN